MKSAIIKIMEDAAIKAGRGLARDFGEIENLQVSKKGPGNFVSSADTRSEKVLMETLRKSRPDFAFLVEESGEHAGQNDTRFRWIIDPLDGTTNFLHGIPHWCISIALEETLPNGKKEIVAAVIHAPALGETYWAEKGQGAYCNDRRLQVSGRNQLPDALLAGYITRHPGPERERDVKALLGFHSNARIIGAAALELAYVAAGKLDGFWHPNLQPWDMAAGILLVREARGMVSEINGGSEMIARKNILAANGSLFETLGNTLAPMYK